MERCQPETFAKKNVESTLESLFGPGQPSDELFMQIDENTVAVNHIATPCESPLLICCKPLENPIPLPITITTEAPVTPSEAPPAPSEAPPAPSEAPPAPSEAPPAPTEAPPAPSEAPPTPSEAPPAPSEAPPAPSEAPPSEAPPVPSVAPQAPSEAPPVEPVEAERTCPPIVLETPTTCGTHNPNGIEINGVSNKILGVSSQEGEWPHTCILFHKGVTIGGASLITPKVLLTAAHKLV